MVYMFKIKNLLSSGSTRALLPIYLLFALGLFISTQHLMQSIARAESLPSVAHKGHPHALNAPQREGAGVQIGGRLWLDVDRDNKQDSGEPGIEGITVKLLDETSTPLNISTLTGVNGAYTFTNLISDTYVVDFDILPALMVLALQDQGSDATDSDVNPANGRSAPMALSDGQSVDIDAGVLSARGMGDHIWLDQDQDGRQDDGEPGFPGITVRLVTSNGTQVFDHTGAPYVQVTNDLGWFTFRDLLPGIYSIGVDLPSHMQFTIGNADGVNGAQDSDVIVSNGRTPAQELPSNDLNRNRDGGIRPGAVADRIWQDLNGNNLRDENESGMAGIFVMLKSPGTDGIPNTGDDRTWFQTETLAGGFYAFPAVFPIQYYISFELPSNGTFVTPDAGNDALDSDVDPATGFSPLFLLSSQETRAGISAGYVITNSPTDVPTATPVPPIDTPTATPLPPTATHTFTPGAPTATQTFVPNSPTATPTPLPMTVTPTGTGVGPTATPGGPTPTDTPSALPSSMPDGTPSGTPSVEPTATGLSTPTIPTSTAGPTAAATPTAGPTFSAGPVTISGGVYHDLNGNAAKEADEPGLSNVLITLSNGQAAMTDDNGTYSFIVPSGEYTIEQAELDGYAATGDADGDKDNRITVLVNGYPMADLNFYTVHMATIQGVIVNDLNGNGQQDAGELGLAGVRVTLSDGQETTTAQDGTYHFRVLPGSYEITVTDLAGYQSIGDAQGPNDNRIAFTVGAGAAIINQNFFDQATQTGGDSVKATILLPLTFR